MTNYKEGLALGLIACLLTLQFGDLTLPLVAKSPDSPDQTKQRASAYGVGATVTVVYKGGLTEQGTIKAINENDFMFQRAGNDRANTIAYGDVEHINYTGKRSYNASKQRDPDQARRVVAGWGPGAHIKVKMTGGATLNGDIGTIQQDHFTLETSSKGEPVKIAYSEVQEIKSKMRLSTKVLLVAIPAGVGLAIMGAFIAATANN